MARALACRPGLLLADEPTSNLDSETARGLVTLLKDVAEWWDTAILMATHDPDVLGEGARRLALKDGELVQS